MPKQVTIEDLLRNLQKRNPLQLFSEDLSEVSDEQLDTALAIRATNLPISCSHYTSSKMVNPNPSYRFANNPGINVCSNPVINASSSDNSPVVCPHSVVHSTCPYYSPDYQIIKKVADTSTDNLFYYLTKYKTPQDYYTYVIYDSKANVYSNFIYTDIKDDDLNSEAFALFDAFINDLMVNVSDVDLYDSVDQQKVEKKSYFSTIFS
jgi:hypothetical protein